MLKKACCAVGAALVVGLFIYVWGFTSGIYSLQRSLYEADPIAYQRLFDLSVSKLPIKNQVELHRIWGRYEQHPGK